MINDDFLLAYDKYASDILRHIYFRVGSREVAEDLTQETFFKTWDSVSNNKTEINNFKTFLYRVASNLIIDYYRKKNRATVSIDEINPEIASIEPEQEKEVDRKMNKKFLERCFLDLGDESRQIVIYRFVNDLNLNEISEITGRSKNSVSVTLHRSLNFLKKEINENYVQKLQDNKKIEGTEAGK